MAASFRFYTRHNLVELLGRRATTAGELRDGIASVPGASIYYHTHRFLQQHHYLSPEPPNDFAFWVTTSLGLDALGELLASVDTVRCGRIEDLRARTLDVLDAHLANGRTRTTACPEGEDFHFMACRTFVLPTPYQARDLREFVGVLDKISIHSIYYHVFEARLRLEKGVNDFSTWFEALGHPDLARAVSRLDPYTMTLDGLRKKIIGEVQRHVRD
ncbi:MAG: hypothetical protein JW742_05030 [Candidatus Aminicenantes bacterium]|nr:hypothetical protein [Candidatus Aminicenantes bacterium]